MLYALYFILALSVYLNIIFCTEHWVPLWCVWDTPPPPQVAMLYVLVLLRVSVLWFPLLRATWLLRSLPPLVPPWIVWVPRPLPLQPHLLPRLSKTTQAWLSLSPCSPRAGQRSSYGDHQVSIRMYIRMNNVAAEFFALSFKDSVTVLFLWLHHRRHLGVHPSDLMGYLCVGLKWKLFIN